MTVAEEQIMSLLRPGQQQAIDTVRSRIRAGEQKTAIVLPTRYGKSDVIRLTAILAKQERLIAGSIALSPSKVLRNQLVRNDQLEQMVNRYGLGSDARKMRTMSKVSEYRPFSNGEHLLSATIQLAARNRDLFTELVEHEAYGAGLPVLVHIDECHETAENKARGDLVQALADAGVFIVLYTATAVRADNDLIPGFEVEESDVGDIRRYVVTDHGDGVHNKIDVFDGVRRVVSLVAHHTTTFKEAWNEEPSPLCKLSRETIEVSLSDLDEREGQILLSECSPSRAQRFLLKAVRHPIVIQKAAELFVHEMRVRQRVNPGAAGIIYTCNDREFEDDAHAHEISKVIESLAPDLVCQTVTMKTEEGDKKAVKQIEQFIQGRGDVLLVKQMAGAGLDAPRLKVLLDLSNVRTVASVIQRLMRVATPWDSTRTCSVITLADPLMEAIWQRYVIEEGGEHVSTIDDLDLVDSYLKVKPPEPTSEPLFVDAAELFGFDDNRGVIGELGNLPVVNELLRRMPFLANDYTKTDLSELLSGFSFDPAPQAEDPGTRSLDELIEEKKAEIVRRAKERAQSEAPYIPASPAAHRERLKFWMNEVKRVADVPLSTELKAIKNLETLDKMLDRLA